MGRQEGGGLADALLAAYTLLLARYAGGEDVVVVRSGARAPAPVQVGLSGDPSFRALVARVAAPAAEAAPGADLALELWATPDGLAVDLSYAAELFDEAMAERVVGHVRALLESAAAEPDAPAWELRMLAPGELDELLRLARGARGWEQRHTLHELFSRRAALAPEAVAVTAGSTEPGTELERAVAAVWEEVLGVRGIGVHRSFFDLGGSLLVVRAAARLEEALGTKVPVLELFQHSTVAALARRLAGGEGEERGGPASEARTEKLSAVRGRLGRLRRRARGPER